MSYLKDNVLLGFLIEDVCSGKGYSMMYPRTKYNKTSDKDLYTAINNTDEFLARNDKDILALFKEISTRLSKGMGVPVKKIELEDGTESNQDGQFYNARLDYGSTHKMYFSTYEKDIFEKLREKYSLDNYLFTIAHENRHGYQFYKFAHLNKNTSDFARLNLMRNEQIMRYYLNGTELKHLIPEDDYKYNLVERDANYYAINFYMNLIKSKKLDINKDNLEFFIEEMLDFNEKVGEKEACELQMENYIKILSAFQNNINPKVYEKFAKKFDLENETAFMITKEGAEKREENVKSYLYESLKMYYDFVKEILPKGYTKEKFDELVSNGEYDLLYNELYEALATSGLNLKPTLSVSNPITDENIYEIFL